MDCGTTVGNVYFVLNDGVQKPDGSWHVVSRRSDHDFTVAKTETISDQVVPDSSSIVTDYGTLTGRLHPGRMTAPKTVRNPVARW